MQPLRVGLLQMASGGLEPGLNLAKGDQFCRRASVLGADIALFPEMWNIGYAIHGPAGGVDDWLSHAVPLDGPYVEHFRSLARELDLAIALSLLEARTDGPCNSAALIDRAGEIRLVYSKVHTCVFGPEGLLTPGGALRVVALDTRHGPVEVGLMICYDREFPETARLLMLQGAEIILTPNACQLETNRLGQFRTRAFENMVGMAMANYAFDPEQSDSAPNENSRFNGHSVAFSPVAFTEDGRSLDTLVVEAGEAEGVFIAEFDLESIRRYREYAHWGAAYRRPDQYELLVRPISDPRF
jgi:predicted amidohydrolase